MEQDFRIAVRGVGDGALGAGEGDYQIENQVAPGVVAERAVLDRG
ncbi:MAG: hypothetical protein ABIU84_17850 [Thermoanaerobaculia bacterium]